MILLLSSSVYHRRWIGEDLPLINIGTWAKNRSRLLT